MSFDWKSTLSTIAPMLATAYGTPLAGMATKVILTTLGITSNPQATEEENQQVISEKLQNATPQELLALKNADYQFKKDMKALDVDLEKLAVGDRESARQMQTSRRSWAPTILAALALVIVMILAYYVIITPNINEYAKGVVLLMLGRFLGYIDSVYSFEFGTTRTSQTKDITIQNLSK